MQALTRQAVVPLASALIAAAIQLPSRSTPTLDDFNLSAQTSRLCVSLPSPVETVTIFGSSALIIGTALLLLGAVFQRRARLRHQPTHSQA